VTVIASWTTMRALFASSAPTFDADGVETWPYHKMRANGFDDGITGVPKPITSFPVTVTVDGQANGAEAYDIYLSQRTDDIASQYMQVDPVLGKSGTWTIALTSAAVTALGLGSTTDQLTVGQVRRVTRHCAIYVQRQSDDAIQWLDLEQASLGNV